MPDETAELTLDDVLGLVSDLDDRVEQLFATMAGEGRNEPTFPESRLFRLAGIDAGDEAGKRTIRKGVQRQKDIAEFKAKAGNDAEIAAQEDTLAKANRDAERTRKALRKQIDDLESKIATADTKASNAAARLDEMHDARERLRGLVPDSVAAEHRLEMSAMESDLGQRYREGRNRLRTIDGTLAIDVGSQKGVEQALHILQIVHGSSNMLRFDQAAWNAHTESLRLERKPLATAVDELADEYRAAMSTIDGILDVYLGGE